MLLLETLAEAKLIVLLLLFGVIGYVHASSYPHGGLICTVSELFTRPPDDVFCQTTDLSFSTLENFCQKVRLEVLGNANNVTLSLCMQVLWTI